MAPYSINDPVPWRYSAPVYTRLDLRCYEVLHKERVPLLRAKRSIGDIITHSVVDSPMQDAKLLIISRGYGTMPRAVGPCLAIDHLSSRRNNRNRGKSEAYFQTV